MEGIFSELRPDGVLTRIIHERSVEVRVPRRKSSVYPGKAANSLRYPSRCTKTEVPLFMSETQLRE